MLNYLNGLFDKKDSFHFQLTSSLPSEALAFYLGNSQKLQGPQVVVTESMRSARQFVESLQFWSDKKSIILDSYDPHLFAGVQISHRQIQNRLAWLNGALNDSSSPIFVAPILGLLQKTLPAEDFLDGSMEFRPGDHIEDSFFEKLYSLGYLSSPVVEDRGHFANRGGLVDVYSPQMEYPVRIELFDSEIESLRFFDPATQRSLGETDSLLVVPAREVLLNQSNCLKAAQTFLKNPQAELQVMGNHLRRQEYCENLEFYLPLFYESPQSPLDYFQETPTLWLLEELNIETTRQQEVAILENFYDKSRHPLTPKNLFFDFLAAKEKMTKQVALEKINIIDNSESLNRKSIEISSKPIVKSKEKKFNLQMKDLVDKVNALPKNTKILFAVKGKPQFERVSLLFDPQRFQSNYYESEDLDFKSLKPSSGDQQLLHFIPKKISKSFVLASEDLAIFSLEELLGKSFQKTKKENSSDRTKHLSFGELKENDYVIHAIHGLCQFKGLMKMPVAGVEAEFLKLEFKDKDKLFLPIYRIHQIHKYASDKIDPQLDKLGGSRFDKVKTKTKKRLREMAHDLIQLYAERSQAQRTPYEIENNDVIDFFNGFPYQETEDQLKAIENILADMSASHPMDRLICGDVGFGKTEVAMRAAFIAAANKKQVAVLAPTTVLTMQHFETFKKRFNDWPLKIEVVNRLKSTADTKKVLEKCKEGNVDILIGTHRLLSQDVGFKDLGLLIIDEEQKFGVKHKEKIRKLKVNIDTLALSATPIPRTLNMSLLNIRDLSLINTAPVDRLETRTFICRHNKDIIQRAVETELKRGGQVFFLHNRVQSIYSVTEELRQLLPGVPMAVGHGQLKEKELESVMTSFFNNETKVLIASAIVESGVDIPNANTILINNADNFGLSQLYQLRGRVGRSGRRAYCYLLTEPNKKLTDIAKERLKVIQENTALGSGLQIAQYDLELRGAGTLLGEEQSGLIDSVGYEFYMQLLDEAIQEAKGEKKKESIEPDINLKIKAFIPSTYIGNIRLRLSYYRALSQIQSPDDIDELDTELRDQFGKPPEEVLNLLGLMLIRYQCVQLGIKDISSGKENLVLSFTDQTPLPAQKVIELTSMGNKKYSLSPDNRLKIRMKQISWPRVHEELEQLLRFCP